MRACQRLVITLPILFLSTLARGDDPAPSDAAPKQPASRTLGILLYDRFELLDVCGPAEIFGNVGRPLKVVVVAEKAGPVASTQGPRLVADFGFEDCPKLDLLLVPGGIGTLKQASNQPLLDWIRAQSEPAELVMSVCSGSAILAKAGLLDGKKATCNKRYFRMLTTPHRKVDWVVEARWVEDGKWVTSSGVSAGMDMSLAVVERLWGAEVASAIADGTEYQRQKDPRVDPFARFVKREE